MKRELRFRIWDNEEKKYFEPIYEAYKGNLLDLSITTNGRVLRRTLETPAEDESRFEGRYVIEQFTGLLDENGNKIFEGDILKGGIYLKYEVKWEHDDCGWNIAQFSVQHFEIIGTIHDNPDLLK